MLQRPRNWDIALAQWARSVLGRQFVWGETDCVSLVRASLTAVHGRAILPLRPKWSTATGAIRAAKKVNLTQTLERLDAISVPLVSAQAGDVLILGRDMSGFDGVGVVLDEDVLLANPERGVYAMRRTELHDLNLTVMRV